MLVLLPPSETKRPGGDGASLDLATLRLPSLRPLRETAVEALVRLSDDADRAARALKLSERQRGEVSVNAALRRAATMPAMDRYTGVLYDALGASALPAGDRAWLADHALIQTAPFGPVGAGDPVPAYRLAAGTSLPGLPPLRRHWASATTEALREAADGLVVDLRSKAYVELGPVPSGVESVYVSVVTAEADGTVRALNHFNKRAKGELARLLAADRPRPASAEDLLEWAASADVDLRPGTARGEILLVAGR
ncbi:peroxide stress protein YaaA [Microbacterium betulae]|uniref:Peroxide stress protein YaaA n=1 Tax=Microbacterium betulae TaxID=2981139 RepID=A0AA97FG83_9MICO|nr:peroxide stress protein YaaA [Microbacterium sp. AB]WOF22098.1 peroxide stress protein YaaA [Microbacterium sp. AB]